MDQNAQPGTVQIAWNFSVLLQALTRIDTHDGATTARLRHQLRCVPARLVRHGRALTLRLHQVITYSPGSWPASATYPPRPDTAATPHPADQDPRKPFPRTTSGNPTLTNQQPSSKSALPQMDPQNQHNHQPLLADPGQTRSGTRRYVKEGQKTSGFHVATSRSGINHGHRACSQPPEHAIAVSAGRCR